jgi:hypothetical protein
VEYKKTRHIKKEANDLSGYFIYRIPSLLMIMVEKEEALSYAKSLYHQLETSKDAVFKEYKKFYNSVIGYYTE